MLDTFARQAQYHIEPLLKKYENDIYEQYLSFFHPAVQVQERIRIVSPERLFRPHILVSASLFLLFNLVGYLLLYILASSLNRSARKIIDPIIDPLISSLIVRYNLQWLQDHALNILFVSSLANSFYPTLQWIQPSPLWKLVHVLIKGVLYCSWMRIYIVNAPFFAVIYLGRKVYPWVINLFPLIDRITARYFP